MHQYILVAQWLLLMSCVQTGTEKTFVFYFSSTMKRHMLRIHATPVDMPCRFCGKIFKNSPTLEAHQRTKGCLKRSKKAEIVENEDGESVVVVPEFSSE